MKQPVALVLAVLALTGTVTGPASLLAAPETAEQAATPRAEAWLALVDQAKYAESWSEAASLFKSAITSEKWKETVTGVRGPLGKVQSRKLKSQKYAEQLPGAPDGKYVIIQFDTVFEHKAQAVETVTPMLDKDGQWRVSGYYIR